VQCGRGSLPAGVRRRQAAPFPVEVDCDGPYPLDFGEFEAVRPLSANLHVSGKGQSGMPVKGRGTGRYPACQSLSGAWSLFRSRHGLKSTPGPVAAAYRKVASLMENRAHRGCGLFPQAGGVPRGSGRLAMELRCWQTTRMRAFRYSAKTSTLSANCLSGCVQI
jgi:hypothetical protein